MPNPLVQRESAGSQTSDRESRQTNRRREPAVVGLSNAEVRCHCAVEETRLSAPAITEGLYSQVKWKDAPTGHPYHAGPGDAGASPAGLGSGLGNAE